MQWEQLTSEDFAAAVRETGVCVVATGVFEKHGQHLPLGTDFLNGHKIACLAAEKEAAVVFAPFYFGQIYEARCFPGTVTIKPALLIELFQGLFDEIGRNGFKKIIVYNEHGGNWNLLQFLNQCSLWEEKNYNVYLYMEELTKEISEIVSTAPGHACEWETSLSLAINPTLVKMDKIPANPADALNRMKDLPNTNTGIGWYSNYPEQYAGDARLASIEKGKAILDLHVNNFTKYISAVKKDEVVPFLNKEFFENVRKISKT
jgi:creatinine amidohydrolase